MFSNRRVGLYQRTYDTGACLMGIRMSFSYHRFSFLNFIFIFKVLSYLYGKCAIFAYVIILLNKLNFLL